MENECETKSVCTHSRQLCENGAAQFIEWRRDSRTQRGCAAGSAFQTVASTHPSRLAEGVHVLVVIQEGVHVDGRTRALLHLQDANTYRKHARILRWERGICRFGEACHGKGISVRVRHATLRVASLFQCKRGICQFKMMSV